MDEGGAAEAATVSVCVCRDCKTRTVACSDVEYNALASFSTSASVFTSTGEATTRHRANARTKRTERWNIVMSKYLLFKRTGAIGVSGRGAGDLRWMMGRYLPASYTSKHPPVVARSCRITER